ncbi:selenocysteine-specific translation elongation factor [Ilumatobacter sp.]|uniref:selenocysteine-specific translation elongation factor n=1 Tax=Ilumatobacter sp. TaxID=1967498 RepID=UPI003B529784
MTVVATAGHVDHGKSSLVLALTGTDPDRFAEEKRRGLTIDLGFAHTTLGSGTEVSFVDVPGHVRFLRNMLAGVGGIDACVFVVAATEGWKPQSEEHLRILELLGISHGIVALTKVDLVDDDLLELAHLDVADHVAGTFLEDAPVVAVSSTTGAGVDEVRDAIDDLVSRAGSAIDRGRPRLWIDRVFAAKGSGTVVTGTLVGGRLSTTSDVHVAPGDRAVRIRSVQSAGRALDDIGPGNRVAVNLSGVDHGELRRGHAVIETHRWHLSDRVDASLEVLPSLDHDVSRRGAYVAYVGSGEHPVRMRVLGSEALAPGTRGSVRMFLPVALPVLPGDRYVLRESGRDETVGGGEILDIAPVLRASRAAPDRSVERVVREREWVGVDELERLTGEAVPPTLGEWVTTDEALAATIESVVERVRGAGPAGIDLAAFDERERAAAEATDEVVVDAGLVRPADSIDPYVDHPFLDELLRGGFAPPSADGVDRNDVRELARRGHVVERDGIVFHARTLDDAADVAAELLARTPDGFTVADFRDATGASRKYVLPLVGELDARGVTRRRGDVRIGGPRLPGQ